VTDDRVPGRSVGEPEEYECKRCGAVVLDVIMPKSCPRGHTGSMQLKSDS